MNSENAIEALMAQKVRSVAVISEAQEIIKTIDRMLEVVKSLSPEEQGIAVMKALREAKP